MPPILPLGKMFSRVDEEKETADFDIVESMFCRLPDQILIRSFRHLDSEEINVFQGESNIEKRKRRVKRKFTPPFLREVPVRRGISLK
jgi:hypothetical protein